MMRMEHPPVADYKTTQNASTKVNNVICKVLLPLLQSPLGTHVSFMTKDSGEISREYLETLAGLEPGLFSTKEKFIQGMSELYDGFSTIHPESPGLSSSTV